MTIPCSALRAGKRARVVGRSVHMTAFLAIAASVLTSTAGATPVTYYFSGKVSEYSYTGSGINPAVGDSIFGTFTYDANYQGEYLGEPWPRATAILDWTLSVGEHSYDMTLFSPLVQIPSVSPDRFAFSDDQPGNSSGAAFFDQGVFEFFFADLAGSLPVSEFLGGAFSFGGGSQNPGDYLRGSIDTLTTIPEPGTLSLLSIALLGLMREVRGGARAVERKIKAARPIRSLG